MWVHLRLPISFNWSVQLWCLDDTPGGLSQFRGRLLEVVWGLVTGLLRHRGGLLARVVFLGEGRLASWGSMWWVVNLVWWLVSRSPPQPDWHS